MFPEGEELVDNTFSHIVTICEGCQARSEDGIANLMQVLEEEYGKDKSGIRIDREHLFEQKVVDEARFIPDAEPRMIIASCTPTGAK